MNDLLCQVLPTSKTSRDDLVQWCRTYRTSTVRSAWRLGFGLVLAKKKHRHGEWMDFLGDIGVNGSSASRYMRLAKGFATEGDLPEDLTTAYAKVGIQLVKAKKDQPSEPAVPAVPAVPAGTTPEELTNQDLDPGKAGKNRRQGQEPARKQKPNDEPAPRQKTTAEVLIDDVTAVTKQLEDCLTNWETLKVDQPKMEAALKALTATAKKLLSKCKPAVSVAA